jgi:hypothetical protein
MKRIDIDTELSEKFGKEIFYSDKKFYKLSCVLNIVLGFIIEKMKGMNLIYGAITNKEQKWHPNQEVKTCMSDSRAI